MQLRAFVNSSLEKLAEQVALGAQSERVAMRGMMGIEEGEAIMMFL